MIPKFTLPTSLTEIAAHFQAQNFNEIASRGTGTLGVHGLEALTCTDVGYVLLLHLHRLPTVVKTVKL